MTEKEYTQTKEELVESISELFLKYGLRSTSMDDICTHLKISKKTLYQFFANKENVVEQVMIHRRSNRRVRSDIEKLLQSDSIEALTQIKDHIINDLSSRLPANLFDIKKYHPEVYERICQNDGEFINDMLRKLLDRGIRDEQFRKDIDQDVQIYLFVKQMDFLGDPEMMGSVKYPLNSIIATIMDNFIRSISTPKGISELEEKIKSGKKAE